MRQTKYQSDITKYQSEELSIEAINQVLKLQTKYQNRQQSIKGQKQVSKR